MKNYLFHFVCVWKRKELISCCGGSDKTLNYIFLYFGYYLLKIH